MVKVIKQDLHGRKPPGERHDTRRLPSASEGQSRPAGEGVAVRPASKHAIEAQPIDRDGATALLDRLALEPRQLQKGHAHAKPALDSIPSAGPRPVGAHDREHGRAAPAAVAACWSQMGKTLALALAQIVVAVSAAGAEQADAIRLASATSQVTPRATPAGAPSAAGGNRRGRGVARSKGIEAQRARCTCPAAGSVSRLEGGRSEGAGTSFALLCWAAG